MAWIDAMRLCEQSIDLLQTNPGIRIHDRRYVYPISPGLRYQGIRLQLIEQVLTLLGERLDLLGRGSVRQRVVRGIELKA